MFDRYKAGDQAILVHVDLDDEVAREDLEELKLLASSAGVNTLAVVTAARSKPDPKFFVGSGKAEEIQQAVVALEANVVIFNHALSPSQEKSLEALVKCRVLDRTTLILDIFAQRARTHEGNLQVELAQLKHISTRLVRGWTHLERQKGGIGLRGPGETQLETDRRLIRGRIKNIEKRLEKVAKQRDQGRRARKRSALPTISLVGYTNAGKSTLFNRLTESDVYAADQLFATLDPTLRKITLEEVGDSILADTVGFIRHLPHDLVAAFKATLQETRDADIQLHVIDAADERRAENIGAVNKVLEEIEADDISQILVYNKIDQLEEVRPHIDRDDEGRVVRVWLSARTGEGCELLLQALTEQLARSMVEYKLAIPPAEQQWRGVFYQLDCIVEESYSELGDWLVDVKMSSEDWNRLNKTHQRQLEHFIIH
ncbi:GTP-binding protein HflX [Catenovulum agarivorans DS-2]|uniref:GTPase HflX n=1 Tax=Catenovulum agarivorans DS-2 TaxID=1328313 RepID=W7QSR9_9ALTE|nr:ribosome rescue GTPase HflX [Catenovulum agarivorans]EWH08435.1 GTP-binding protein HflX [Catenovulum agarivorans DS-2]